MTLMYPVASVRPALWSAGRTAIAIAAAVGIASGTAVAVSYADTGSAGTGGQFPRGQFGGGQFGGGQFGGGQFGGPPGVGGQAGPLTGGVPGTP